MLPVSSDALAWIAQELSLSLLEDGEDGATHQVAGQPILFDGPLSAAAAQLAGLESDDPDVATLVDRAREGLPGTLEVSGPVLGRLLAWSDSPGRARVLFAPHADAVARRAAAADLAAGVTHEVANALTAIAGWTRMAAATGPLPDRTRHALEVVQRSARDALGSARSLLSAMRDAGRVVEASSSSAEHTHVSQVVGEVLDTLRPELEEAGIRLETELATHTFGAVTPAALRLIVDNLVRNAFEALRAGGRIHVRVEEVDDRLRLTVADDGPGMSGKTLAQAFDRYFTTKENGTGLGLALVRDTVHEAGGRVEVESRKGTGTRFDIWLPAAGAARLSLRPPQVTTASTIHPRPAFLDRPSVLDRRQVLVVDDDEALRSLVRTALELQGATVRTAARPSEALALGGPFSLALVDLSLDGERGDQLLGELRASGRVERAILLTGSPDAELDPSCAPDAVLRKPFELEELSRVIEGVLQRPST
jgi:signal transduction histidine kinase